MTVVTVILGFVLVIVGLIVSGPGNLAYFLIGLACLIVGLASQRRAHPH